MDFFTQFNRNVSKPVAFPRPSMTEQAHKSEYDINRLLDRAKRTGVAATVDQIRNVYYGDFSMVDQAMENEFRMIEARERFMELPANVRAYFENDPRRLLQALGDETKINKLVELGIVKASQQIATPNNPLPVAQEHAAVAAQNEGQAEA